MFRAVGLAAARLLSRRLLRSLPDSDMLSRVASFACVLSLLSFLQTLPPFA